MDENYNPHQFHSQDDNPGMSSESLRMQNKDFLMPKSFSPETRSMQSLSG